MGIVRDDDVKPTVNLERNFLDDGGTVFIWTDGYAVEDEIFLSVTKDGIRKLLDYAIELHGSELVDSHIISKSDNAINLASIQAELDGELSIESRQFLGSAAKVKRQGWFKSVTWMEHVGREIVGPDLSSCNASFREKIESIFNWSANVGR